MDLADRLAHIRTEIQHHRREHDCGTELLILESLIEELETDLIALVEILLAGQPATITISDSQNGHTMASYPVNTPVKISVSVKNNAGTELPAAAVTVTTDAGTLTPDPTNPHLFTLLDGGIGTATVTAVAGGITGTDPVGFEDDTPATVTVTDTAA